MSRSDFHLDELKRWLEREGSIVAAADLLSATVGPAEALLLLEHRGTTAELVARLPAVLAYRRASSDQIPAAVLRRLPWKVNGSWAHSGKVVWVGEFDYLWPAAVKDAFWRLRPPMGLPDHDDVDRLELGQVVQWQSYADSIAAAHRQEVSMRVIREHPMGCSVIRDGLAATPPGSSSRPPR